MIVFGQLTMIPDANFEQALINQGYDSGTVNGSVYTSLINTITHLDISNPLNNQIITDLTGIEDFTALISLHCGNNQLTTLDLSNNTALTELDCSTVGWLTGTLTSLDVSQNTALTYLNFRNNQLTTLDLSNNTALTELWCQENQLTTLDVSNNTALTELWCVRNQLTTLDVSNNTALTNLMCHENQLTTLDISGATALTDLYCNDNQLTTLDLSNNTSLHTLWCVSNQLTTLDVSNNTALTELQCGWNQLISLNVSGSTALADLECQLNQLTSLDVSQNTALTHLDCWSNQLTSLDVRNGNNTIITNFNCTTNPNLTCINVDDFQYSLFNWPNIDPQHYFSSNCSGTAIQELTTNKELLRTIDVLGRKTKKTNQPLLYIYDDGTIEKRITIE